MPGLNMRLFSGKKGANAHRSATTSTSTTTTTTTTQRTASYATTTTKNTYSAEPEQEQANWPLRAHPAVAAAPGRQRDSEAFDFEFDACPAPSVSRHRDTTAYTHDPGAVGGTQAIQQAWEALGHGSQAPRQVATRTANAPHESRPSSTKRAPPVSFSLNGRHRRRSTDSRSRRSSLDRILGREGEGSPEPRTYQPTGHPGHALLSSSVSSPPAPSDIPSRPATPAYVDLLDAHSLIASSAEAQRDRRRASGARNYGEDVADRNMDSRAPSDPAGHSLHSMHSVHSVHSVADRRGANTAEVAHRTTGRSRAQQRQQAVLLPALSFAAAPQSPGRANISRGVAVRGRRDAAGDDMAVSMWEREREREGERERQGEREKKREREKETARARIPAHAHAHARAHAHPHNHDHSSPGFRYKSVDYDQTSRGAHASPLPSRTSRRDASRARDDVDDARPAPARDHQSPMAPHYPSNSAPSSPVSPGTARQFIVPASPPGDTAAGALHNPSMRDTMRSLSGRRKLSSIFSRRRDNDVPAMPTSPKAKQTEVPSSPNAASRAAAEAAVRKERSGDAALIPSEPVIAASSPTHTQDLAREKHTAQQAPESGLMGDRSTAQQMTGLGGRDDVAAPQSTDPTPSTSAKYIVHGAAEAPSLEGIVDLTNTVDTDITTKTMPAVIHEHITPTQHEILEEHVFREIHHHDFYNRVLPIICTEVLPSKHYVYADDMKSLVEVSADVIPRFYGRPTRTPVWQIVDTPPQSPTNFSRDAYDPYNVETYRSPSSPKRMKPLPREPLEPTKIYEWEHMSPEGIRRKETIWRHPPVLQATVIETGELQPVYYGPGGDMSEMPPTNLPAGTDFRELLSLPSAIEHAPVLTPKSATREGHAHARNDYGSAMSHSGTGQATKGIRRMQQERSMTSASDVSIKSGHMGGKHVANGNGQTIMIGDLDQEVKDMIVYD